MTFDFQPQLDGRRTSMRPTDRSDVDALCRIASDAALWAQHPVPELCQRDVFLANINDGFDDRGGLTVRDRGTGKIIGYSRYSQTFSGPEAIEIGWTMLGRQFWGGAYNRDIKRAMLRHAFVTFPSVIFRVGEANWRSRRALEKIGAEPNGWEQDVECFGRVGRRVGYTLTRESFLRGPLAS